MIVTESVKHPTATENVVQKSLMNSCSDTHTPISDQDYNMTRGTVILRSPCARVSSLQGRIHRGGPAPPLLVHQWKYGEGEGEEEVEERRKNGEMVEEEEISSLFDSVLHPPLRGSV